jgi:hypothetical protein
MCHSDTSQFVQWEALGFVKSLAQFDWIEPHKSKVPTHVPER